MKRMTAGDVYFSSWTDDEKEKEIQKIGRALFSTPDGAIFLSIMLDDLAYNREAEDAEDEARRNYATFFLRERLGLTRDSMAVTTALLKINDKDGEA